MQAASTSSLSALSLSDSSSSFLPASQASLVASAAALPASPSSPESENAASPPPAAKHLSRLSLSPAVLDAQYAVRGELAIRAEDLRKTLAHSPSVLPFKEVVSCNIGNPQQLGQKPITFFRQVSSLLEFPNLPQWLEQFPALRDIYPEDVLERAMLLASHAGPIGAYSHSKGIRYIREQVAKFIERRDGFASDPEMIFLSSGASSAIHMVLQALIKDSSTGILIPSPQYPLYSATITLLGGQAVYYDLDEASGWSLSVDEIFRAVNRARLDGIQVRALCIINPGNPTGNVLSKENLQHLIHFCYEEKLVLLADEVYQDNIFYPETKPFYSAKKVMKAMGAPYADMELFSFHSISKGLIGECGRRGGYVECSGIQEEVIAEMYKLASISLCSNTLGQIMVELMVNPPKEGDPSYALYMTEREHIFNSLKRRSTRMVETLRRLEGVSCQSPEGAMYLFPSFDFPQKFIEEAIRLNYHPDTLYALKLLNATGICTVSGAGFGQKPGTYHIRFTFLPPEESFASFLSLLESFHVAFMDQYR